MPDVLFVCVHNAGRSRMAEAIFNREAGGRLVAGLRGHSLLSVPMPRSSRRCGRSASTSMRRRAPCSRPRWPTTLAGSSPCAAPSRRPAPATTTPIQAWALDDPKGKPAEEVCRIRDDIIERVCELVAELE
jgi:arsenate reductase (thioredoxin)